MTYTPPPTPPSPPPMPPAMGGTPAASADRSTMWGWLGIVIGLCCCGILGIIFGALSVRDAKKYGKSPVLGYVAIACGIIGAIGQTFGGMRYSSGDIKWGNN